MIHKTAADEIKSYPIDASNFQGYCEHVFIPETKEELIQAVSYCFARNIPITASGAGTGLTGGRAALGGAIISAERLNKILSFEPKTMEITVEPGVTLKQIEEFLYPLGYFLPTNPTEKLASIGGNIATNASGARTFKYGPIRSQIQKLDIVLADGSELLLEREKSCRTSGEFVIKTVSGTVISLQLADISMPKVKNAAGYYIKKDMDIIDLFIGSEGTLGIFCGATLRVLPLPEEIFSAIIFFSNSNEMFNFLDSIRDLSRKNNFLPYNQCDDLSARLIEFYDKNSLELLRTNYAQIPIDADCALWIEQEVSRENYDLIFEKWYLQIEKYSSLFAETWIASNPREHARFSDFRHELPLQVNEVFTKNNQTKIGTDTAVADKHSQDFFNYLVSMLDSSKLPYVIYGHIGNSHYHANIFVKNDEERNCGLDLYKKICQKAVEYGGTVSAEHGIGKLKRDYLKLMYSDETINAFKQIKMTLDNKYLLGAGNIFTP